MKLHYYKVMITYKHLFFKYLVLAKTKSEALDIAVYNAAKELNVSKTTFKKLKLKISIKLSK